MELQSPLQSWFVAIGLFGSMAFGACESGSLDSAGSLDAGESSDSAASTADSGAFADSSDASLSRPDWGHENDVEPTLIAKKREASVSVDGELRERDYRLAMPFRFEDSSGESSSRAVYRAVWDGTHLYLAAKITDDRIEYDGARKAFENDSAEILLDPERDRSSSPKADDLHLFGLPEADSIVKRGGTDGFEPASSTELKAAATTTSDGYAVELRLRWSDLQIEPKTHRRLGLALAVNDRDGSDRIQFSWDEPDDLLVPADWGDLRLGPERPTSDVPKPDSNNSDSKGCTYPPGPEPNVSKTINLGDQGLSDGDSIDSYLDTHFKPGNKVVIPAGKYDWSGQLGGDFDRDAVLCGDGQAVLQAPDGNEHHGTFDAENGALVRLMNLTLAGVAKERVKNRIAFQATSQDARIQIINVRHPDGAPGGGHPSPMGFYVRSRNVGEILFKDCYIANFPNNGIYTTDNDGKVVVDGCVFEGNRSDNLRMSDNDVARNVLIKMNGGEYDYSGRGIRFRYPGSMRLENIHIVNEVGASPIQTATADRVGGSVEVSMKDVFIENNSGATPIHMKTGSATGENVHITGSGDLNPEGVSGDICTGSSCTSPETDIQQIRK